MKKAIDLPSKLKCAAYRLINRLTFPSRRKKGVLFYVGLNRGHTFKSIFKQYKRCYGFEANPELFEALQAEYRQFSSVHLFNVAVANYNGEIEFYISSNDGLSSSIGHFDEKFCSANNEIRMEKTIRVPCINLYDSYKKKALTILMITSVIYKGWI